MKKLSILVLAMLFVFGMATAAMAASYNSTTSLVYYAGLNGVTGETYNPINTEFPSSLATTDGQYDNGILNANGTGVGAGGKTETQSVIKNAADLVDPAKKQATHGSYQNNTNSCASCHQTHTGAGETLLFKDSVYTTCTACHDGTLGIYNVFANGAAASTAGTFAGTIVGNASMHLANGSVEILAAPGGKGPNAKTIAGGTDWAEEFNCASCHAPHGSYSDRLLQNNANGMQTQNPAVDPAGRKNVNLNVYGVSGQAIPNPALALSTDKIVLFDTVTNLQQAVSDGKLANWSMSYPANNPNIDAGDYVTVLVYKSGSKWSIDTTPWLYVYDSYSTKSFASTLKTSTAAPTKATEVEPLTKGSDFATPSTKGGHYMYGLGYMWMNSEATGNYTIANFDYADIAQANVVKFTFKESAPGDVYFQQGSLFYKKVDPTKYTAAITGTKLSSFCSSCHVDYMVAAGDADGNGLGNGTYTEAYRHNTSSANYMCLKCHFAHGTDVEIMMDSMDNSLITNTNIGSTALAGGDTAANRAYLLDSNPSSALKRYTNMSVCWKCHTSSHAESFLNGNADFYNNYDNRPHGY